MTRRNVGAVVAVILALACSACGSKSDGATAAPTITSAQPASALQQLPIRRSGVGPESLGTFAMHGWLYIKTACVGKGTFGVWWNKNGADRACLDSRHRPTVETSSNFPVYDHSARIAVRAPAGMKWTIIVFEGPPDLGPRSMNVW